MVKSERYLRFFSLVFLSLDLVDVMMDNCCDNVEALRLNVVFIISLKSVNFQNIITTHMVTIHCNFTVNTLTLVTVQQWLLFVEFLIEVRNLPHLKMKSIILKC